MHRHGCESGDHETLTSSLTIVRWNFGTACTVFILITFRKKVNAEPVERRCTSFAVEGEPFAPQNIATVAIVIVLEIREKKGERENIAFRSVAHFSKIQLQFDFFFDILLLLSIVAFCEM